MPIVGCYEVSQGVKLVASSGMRNWTQVRIPNAPEASMIEDASESSTATSVALVCGSLGTAIEVTRLPFKGR